VIKRVFGQVKKFLSFNTTGTRLETYIIPGKYGSGVICMNGAAHLIKKGEEVIIMGFELSDKPITPKIVFVD
jgi:aspartate 1-decarboxylase